MAAILGRLRSVFNFMKDHGVMATMLVTTFTTGAGASYYAWIKPWFFINSIDSTLKKGTKPHVNQLEHTIDRPNEYKKIKELLKSSHDTMCQWGIILGPTGTGKTHLVRQVIKDDPSYILYHAIRDPNMAASELSKVAGFIQEGFIDFVFGTVMRQPDYRLPEDKSIAVGYVLDKVAERSKYLIQKKKLKNFPCFVIDNADLVAKKDPDMFAVLVDRAKYFGVEKSLKIVFVSSEGNVIPLIPDSSRTRSWKFVEILDVKEQEATDYLHKRGFPVKLTECLANLTGKRVVFLNMVSSMYLNKSETDDEFMEDIEKHLDGFSQQAFDIAACYAPTSRLIISQILKNGSMSKEKLTDSLLSNPNISNAKEVHEVIDNLVHGNLLRYQSDKKLTWHSALILRGVKTRYTK